MTFSYADLYKVLLIAVKMLGDPGRESLLRRVYLGGPPESLAGVMNFLKGRGNKAFVDYALALSTTQSPSKARDHVRRHHPSLEETLKKHGITDYQTGSHAILPDGAAIRWYRTGAEARVVKYPSRMDLAEVRELIEVVDANSSVYDKPERVVDARPWERWRI